MKDKDVKQILLRLPKGLWEDVSRWADDELRSVNAQIEYVLKCALEKSRGSKAQDGRQD